MESWSPAAGISLGDSFDEGSTPSSVLQDTWVSPGSVFSVSQAFKSQAGLIQSLCAASHLPRNFFSLLFLCLLRVKTRMHFLEQGF